MPTLSDISAALAPVVSAMGSDAFPSALALALRELVGADDVTLLQYGATSLPTIAYSAPPGTVVQGTLETYLKGPFLLDPFYRTAANEHRFGVFQLNDLAPEGFHDSEYYRGWYRNCGFNDECGLLIPLSDGFINLALGVTGSNAQFSPQQVRLLEDLFPLVSAIAQHHWRGKRNQQPSQPGLRQQLHCSLAAFGASILTKRERQITELVLLGNSTRMIAEKLGISTETVKLHRKHAYAKLDVSSQAELFLLFMEALAHSPNSGNTDPLIAYQSKPGKP